MIRQIEAIHQRVVTEGSSIQLSNVGEARLAELVASLRVSLIGFDDTDLSPLLASTNKRTFWDEARSEPQQRSKYAEVVQRHTPSLPRAYEWLDVKTKVRAVRPLAARQPMIRRWNLPTMYCSSAVAGGDPRFWHGGSQSVREQRRAAYFAFVPQYAGWRYAGEWAGGRGGGNCITGASWRAVEPGRPRPRASQAAWWASR